MVGPSKDLRLEILLEGLRRRVVKAKRKFNGQQDKLDILRDIEQLLDRAISERRQLVQGERETPCSKRVEPSPQSSQEAGPHFPIGQEIIRALVREVIGRIMDL